MTTTDRRAGLLAGLGGVVAALALVEVASGFIQGWYTPLFTDIARNLGIHDADVNWFEAAQLMFSALAVPVLAKMGDLWGHKRILLASTAVTAVASFGVAFAPTFATYLVAWALQGAYVVWLPLEVAIIYLAARRVGAPDAPLITRRAAGTLVFALEGSVIVAALGAGAMAGAVALEVVLLVPAVVVTLCLAAIWFFVPATPASAQGRLDWIGVGLLTVSLGVLMLGLTLVRILGPGSAWPWLAIAGAVAVLWPAMPTPTVAGVAASGGLLIGSTREFAGFDRSTTLAGIEAVARHARRIMPALATVNIIRTFAGLRPYTPDGLPIHGPVMELPGLIMAAGHEGDGIALAPVTGKKVAEFLK